VLKKFVKIMKAASGCVAIVMSCDLLAIQVKRMAEQTGIGIPEHALLMSCRDSFLCAMPQDLITAVCEPTFDMGFEAAGLLHSLLSGHGAPQRPILIEATKRVERVSTIDPSQDLLVAKARAFIRNNAYRVIKVSDVVAFLRVSRVTFERRFREEAGCTPGEEIRTVRLDAAQELLANSQGPIAEVALSCGFENSSQFSTFFRNRTGQTPTQFRNAARNRADYSSHGQK